MNAKRFFIGIFYTFLGIFTICAIIFKTDEILKHIFSIDFILHFSFASITIVIGFNFINRKKWAYKAIQYLNILLIVGICGIGIKMIINGIFDCIKIQSLASSIGLLFGLGILISSIPFFIVNACIQRKEIKDSFFESMNFKKKCNNYQKKIVIKKSRKMLLATKYVSFFVGLVAVTFVLFNLDKIFYWEEFIDLGEYRLSVRDWGKGEPIVIIEGGLAQEKDKYFLISFFTSNITRVIAYDHAGIGNSTKSHNQRLLKNYVEELKSLMRKKNINPPFIFVGHSSGGHIIRYYAHLYPSEVLGIVFIDVPPEGWLKYIRNNWSEEELKSYFKWWYPDNPDMTDTRTVEKFKYEENANFLRGMAIPYNIPVLMFIGNNKSHFRKDNTNMIEDMKAWIDQQSSIVINRKNAEVLIDLETGHYPFKDKPIMVIKNINKFIKKIMDGMERESAPMIGQQ